MKNQTNTTTPKKIMLNYGSIYGFVTILISVINYAFGNIYKPHWSVSVISNLVIIAIIVMGLKKLKENNGGYLTLGESFKTGLGIVLIGVIIGLIYTYIFMTFIEPNYINNMMELQQQKMQANPNMTDEQIEAGMKIAKKFMGFSAIAIGIFLWSLFLGFITSLIAGLIMKKVPEQEY